MVTDYQSNIVRFGVFEIDLRAGELRRNGSKIKLQEQPFQILAILLEHPGARSWMNHNVKVKDIFGPIRDDEPDAEPT